MRPHTKRPQDAEPRLAAHAQPTVKPPRRVAQAVRPRRLPTYQGFLAELLLAEVDDRDRRSSIRRVKAAGFPCNKWLGDFDFTANGAINPATVHELAKGDWIRKATHCA